MKLFGLIFDNAGLKVLALGMAWAVWFMVSQSLNDTQQISLNVTIAVDNDGAVRATPIDPADPCRVIVEISGPKSAVAGFERVADDGEATLHVTSQHHPQDMERQVVFLLEDLSIPGLSDFPGVRATNMEPSEIRVNVERMEVRDTPVMRPEIRERTGSVEVRIVTWDTVVKIRASAKHLPKRLATLRTSVDPEVLMQLAGSIGEAPSINEEVPLTVAPDQAPLFELVDQDAIKVRLELRQIDESAFVVPVRIFRTIDGPLSSDRSVWLSRGNDVDNRLKDIYEPGADGAQPTLRLMLEGSPAAIASVDPAQLLAFVLEDEMEDGATLANLSVHIAGLPVGVRLKQPITLAVERDQ